MEASLIGPFGPTALGSTRLTIGRAPDNNIVLNDARASSHHAEIRPEGEYYSIVDLGSTNGTFVNDQQIYSGSPRLLQPGDTIRIGDTTFKFEGSSAGADRTAYAEGIGSTMRATPSSGPVMSNVGGGNTSYGGGGNYGGQQDYGETVPAQPPSYMDQQPYAPPPAPPPYMSETQMPTYTPSSYGQSGQGAYTPPPPSAYAGPPSGPQPEMPVYNPPPEQPKRGSPLRNILLAVVALAVVIAAVAIFFVVQHNNQVTQNNNSTATANANNHATSTAIALATAHAQETAAASATALVTSHYPPFTTLALYAPLTTSSSQWDTNSSCQFTSSGYQVSIAQAGYFHWCLASQQFADIAFQVNMTITQGDCGGLMFRYVDSNNFYMAEVCQNGTYNLGDFVNGNANYLYTNPRSSSAIQQGPNQTNVVAIVVQGNTVNMYVNGHQIDTATSDTLTSSQFSQGAVGMLADDVSDPTAVTYTNALVWTQS